ncbi:valyl-tRNA synthetase [Thermocrinis albus DSM 14484]|uniref:Valine--tRNA ligase n=1 Tax=Thermocrinis albus (strain DSM 14484 / JCM 11386 / HI 11/12) TaxID=638303 RepID=D3SLP0_THEAH|nr:valine--tRNA ligase [Thermocrinis albus]ADC89670.1 valyl-tRNA synthetase [Thermocrinis albus DSM 14484]
MELREYDHRSIEERIAKEYVESKIFSSDTESSQRFSVVIPPPNVTGSLHMGHALNVTLQDVLCRWNRMRGKRVVWVPGFDHAGIATQYVVDRQLQQEGKSRFQIGREEFLKKVWEWVPISRDSIKNQLIRMGASVDWRRERFTLDEGFSRLVRYAFRKLYEEGLIYRGEYIVNWCPSDLTALSDLEVEHEEEDGKLYYIRYPLEDGSGYITVATTRPETMLGDTAVAVHPDDERYRELVGKKVRLPLVEWERKDIRGNLVKAVIPIVADERVKPDFGTGAVKITPAHDPLDFEIGRTHQLPFVKVMDEKARMNENAGPFMGMDRYEAREAVIQRLKELGLLEKVEEHQHAVGRCYRCKTVIEPMVSVQWFLKTSDPVIKEKALAAVRGYEEVKDKEFYSQIVKTSKLGFNLRLEQEGRTILVVHADEGVDFLVGRKEGEIAYIYLPEGREDLLEDARGKADAYRQADLLIKISGSFYIIRETGQEKKEGPVLLLLEKGQLIMMKDSEKTPLGNGEAKVEPLHGSFRIETERKKISQRERKKIRFVPENWEKIYLQWIENLKDWCISRQIWWGHRIPVWYCQDCGEENIFTDEDFDRIYDKIIFNLIADGKLPEEFTPEEVHALLSAPHFVHPHMTVLDFYRQYVFNWPHTMDMSPNALRLFFTQDANPMAILTEKRNRYRYNPSTKKFRFVLRCKRCGSENLRWEEDVLDTWFSSALWPFGVWGYPEKTKDLSELYPTDLLVTGFDIIFFWVARMVMMGMHFMKDIPFRDVYIHALVRDEKGQKMSKTKGNVIDPLDIIEKYGADALRFTLSILTQQGRDIKLSEKRFEGYKHFANKLWNAARFVLMNLQEDLLANLPMCAPPRWEDLWITTLLNETVKEVNEALERYDFSRACQKIYDFVWSEFCDWYIEMSKIRLYAEGEDPSVKGEKLTAQATLLRVLDTVLRLLHPFMPFITEELWRHLPTAHKEFLALAEYPVFNPQEIFPEAKEKIERLKEIITSIRSLRSDLRIEPSRKIKVYYRGEESEELVREMERYIKALARVEELIKVSSRPPKTVAKFSKDLEFYVSASEDIKVDELINSYTKKLQETKKLISQFRERLSNERFLTKAPPEEVERTRQMLEEYLEEEKRLEELLRTLKEALV